jgi:tetratricopeptide (TPR) repeat protein
VNVFLAVFFFANQRDIEGADKADIEAIFDLAFLPAEADCLTFPFAEIVQECSAELAENKEINHSRRYELHLRRGFAFGGLGKYSEAVDDFNESLKLRPRDALALHFRATTMFSSGKKEEGHRELNDLIKLHPQFANAYVTLAHYYCSSGHYQECVDHANKAIALQPKNSEAYLCRAQGHQGLIHLQQALDDLNKCIQLVCDPGTSNASLPYLYRGFINVELRGKPAEGLRDLLMAIHLNPSSINNRIGLWSYYFKMGKYHIANRISDQLLHENPTNVGASYCRIACLIQQDLIDEAMEIAGKAVMLAADDQSSCASFWARANVHFAKGDYKKCLEDYNRAESIQPKDYRINGSKAYFLATSPDEKFRNGETAKKLALQWCNATAMENARFLMLLAMANAECGDFDEAVRVGKKSLEKAHANFPWLEEYKQRVKLFEQRKPFRFDPKTKVFDFIY